MSHFFSAIAVLLFAFSVTGCSTITGSVETNTPIQTCSNSPVLVADLTKVQPLLNTQLPNGHSCAGETV